MKPIGIIDKFCEHEWKVVQLLPKEPEKVVGELDRLKQPISNNLPLKTRYFKCIKCGSTAKSTEQEIIFKWLL